MIPGYHLEGPFISPVDGYRGAHPLPHVREPDWDEFRKYQDGANGRIKLVTLAPELPGALHLIERLTKSGVVVALGHTAADGNTIRDAVRAGAKLSTHLGNGCPVQLHRHSNPIWEQLAEDGLAASIIADGHHLPPAVLKVLLRSKTNIILTSDLGSLAGLPPGIYREWDQALEVMADGRIVLAGTPYLAGAAKTLDECVGNVARIVGHDFARSMAVAAPRQLLGLQS
jgi:N-acetylglucosamine-6-phosphate deacetylase